MNSKVLRSVGGSALSKLNTSALRTSARGVVLISDPTELENHLRRVRTTGHAQPCIVGELSNTILLPNIDESLVLYRDGRILDLRDGAKSSVIVKVQESCSLDAVVAEVCRRGLSGVERLSGIPGTIGAAAVQDVAAYNQAIEEVFVSAEVLDTETGDVEVLDHRDMGFSYRTSALRASSGLSPRFVVLNVTIALSKGPPASIDYADLADWHCRQERSITDPSLIRASVLEIRSFKGMVVGAQGWTPCSGSFFMGPRVSASTAGAVARRVRGSVFAEDFLSWYRPDATAVRLPAALVLRAAGFMNGDRWGSVGLGSQHILALCNLGHATGDDILTVSEFLQRRATEELGISLIREVRVVGRPIVTSWEEFTSKNPYVAGTTEPEWVSRWDD